MRNILFVFVMLIFVTSCKHDEPATSVLKEWDRNKVKSYTQYAEDGVKEVYKEEFQYDSIGRLVKSRSFLEGIVTGSSYNYVYDGRKRTFLMDMYPKEDNTIITRVEEEYLDDDFCPNKLALRTNVINGQVSREEYLYDNSGKERGRKNYYFGNLVSESIDYTYDRNSVSYIINIYSDGELIGKRRVKTVFDGKGYSRSKILSSTQYQGDSNTPYTEDIYTYDDQGRENGYKSYYLGNLMNEQTDYVYNDDDYSLTFYLYAHKQNASDQETTRNKIKIEFY